MYQFKDFFDFRTPNMIETVIIILLILIHGIYFNNSIIINELLVLYFILLLVNDWYLDGKVKFYKGLTNAFVIVLLVYMLFYK